MRVDTYEANTLTYGTSQLRLRLDLAPWIRKETFRMGCEPYLCTQAGS
jgi:hypothetical protein